MQVHLKFFASIRETVGSASQVVTTQASTLGGLRDELLASGLAYASLGRSRAVRMALNQVMADESAALQDGCEVAFFPPVTGG